MTVTMTVIVTVKLFLIFAKRSKWWQDFRLLFELPVIGFGGSNRYKGPYGDIYRHVPRAYAGVYTIKGPWGYLYIDTCVPHVHAGVYVYWQK